MRQRLGAFFFCGKYLSSLVLNEIADAISYLSVLVDAKTARPESAISQRQI